MPCPDCAKLNDEGIELQSKLHRAEYTIERLRSLNERLRAILIREHMEAALLGQVNRAQRLETEMIGFNKETQLL